MAFDLTVFKQKIQANIFPNNERRISAIKLLEVLEALVDSLETIDEEFTTSLYINDLRSNTNEFLKIVFVIDENQFGAFVKASQNIGRPDNGLNVVVDANGNEWLRVQDPYASIGEATEQALALKQDLIPSSSVSNYYAGDKTWQPFPAIPTNNNQLTNGAGFVTSSSVNTIVSASIANFSSSIAVPQSNAPATAGYILSGSIIRKQDTLYNVLDRFTSEYVTYSKVTTHFDGSVMSDGKCDGVVFAKYGTEYFKRNYSSYIQPEWFGVKGDGVTDDTAAFQTFINVVPAGGIIKLSPDRTYVFNSTVTVNKPNITLDGNGSTVKGIITIGDGTAREYNVKITRFRFDNTTNCIAINKARRVHIFDNHFKNADKAIIMTPTTGFHVNAQINIYENTFTDVNYCWYSTVSDGISWDVLSDCYFSNNIVNNALITPVELQGIDGLTAVGNTFFFSNTVGIRETKRHHFKITLQSDWVTFDDNKFFEAGYESLYLDRCRHLIVNNNHFARSGQADIKSVIYLNGDPTSAALEKPTWIISNNTVSLFSKDFVEINSGSYGNVSITGNTVNYNNFFPQFFGSGSISGSVHYVVNTGAGKNTKINVVEEGNYLSSDLNFKRSSGNVSIQNKAISDFNDINGQGWFVSTSNPTNGPVAGFGQGFRIYVDDNTFSYKDFFCFGTDWYKRSGTTSAPGTWYKVYDSENIKSSLQDSFLVNQSALTNAASIDTIQTQGIYVRGSDSGNTAALGYPYDGIQKGILLVLKWDANNISQEYKVANGDVFVRYCNSTTWTTWKQSNNINKYANTATPKTANYNLTANDRTVLFDATSGNLTGTLPTAAGSFINGSGQIYTIKKIDSSTNTITVDGNTTETIEGNLTFTLYNQNDTVEIQSNGVSWNIISLSISPTLSSTIFTI